MPIRVEGGCSILPARAGRVFLRLDRERYGAVAATGIGDRTLGPDPSGDSLARAVALLAADLHLLRTQASPGACEAAAAELHGRVDRSADMLWRRP